MIVTRALFVAGAGTEIGKTYVTAALTRRLREQGRAVRALKPLASGVPPIDDPAFAQSDTGVLLAAQGLPITPETVAACSPWRFLAPLAPDLAAAREGRSLTLDALVAWCEARLAAAAHEDSGMGANPLSGTGYGLHGIESHQPVIASGAKQSREPRRPTTKAGLLRSARNDGGVGIKSACMGEGARRATHNDASGDEAWAEAAGTTLLIEGVGGLMSPVTQDATGLDWLKRLRLPALLVSGSYLGAISHALTAAETLRAYAVPLAAIVVSESADAPVPPETVAEAIDRRIGAPVLVLPRGAQCPDALMRLV